MPARPEMAGHRQQSPQADTAAVCQSALEHISEVAKFVNDAEVVPYMEGVDLSDGRGSGAHR